MMTAKKSAAATRPRAAPGGKSARASAAAVSRRKGKKFEDRVAEIYRLLGAEVVQNIAICNKKVDILATFKVPGSRTSHRVIVECKDEVRARDQNQRVMQFHGLLNTARKAGEAESAEIITRVPWGDEAKGFAHRSGISLLTLREKMSQLIDFSEYLNDIIRRFEAEDAARPAEPPIGSYYVDLNFEKPANGETERIPDIDEYVRTWLAGDSGRHLAVLGEFGTGKSCFCLKLARDLARRYLEEPGTGRIPILLSLRDFTKTVKIEALIASFLDEECGVANPRFRLFKAMNDAGMFAITLDGLDEMATHVYADTLDINLQEIEKLGASSESRLILTSRIEFFTSGAEERRALRPRGEVLATRSQEYEPVTILPWDETQISDFIEKRVPLIEEAEQPWTHYRDEVRRIPELAELSERPVMLEMIVRTLPALLASGKPINRPNIYEMYLVGEIKRQKVLKKRTLLLSEEARSSAMRALALQLWGTPTGGITFSDAIGLIEESVKPPREEVEAYTRDFVMCSFLVRKGDVYSFSHRSIMEYLVATVLGEEIKSGRPVNFATHPLTPVVTVFLSDLDPSKQRLRAWIRRTRGMSHEDAGCLAGNAATVLCRLDRSALAGRDLNKTVITDADLSGCDIRGANLAGATLERTHLADSLYCRDDLAKVANLLVRVSLLVVSRSLSETPAGGGEWFRLVELAVEDAIREVNPDRTGLASTRGAIIGSAGARRFVAVVDFVTEEVGHMDRAVAAARGVADVEDVALYADDLERCMSALPPDVLLTLEHRPHIGHVRRRHRT